MPEGYRAPLKMRLLLQYCVAACLRCSHTGVYAVPYRDVPMSRAQDAQERPLLDGAAPCLEAKSIIFRGALY